jgi:integrase/recombinase XerD
MRSSPHRLTRWDAAVASYIANRQTFGRVYAQEQWILGTVRKRLVIARAADLDQRLFDQWRKTFQHLNSNTRRGRETAVYKFCRYRRRAEPRCFLPNALSFARCQPHRPPVIIEPAQIAQLLDLASTLRPHQQSPLYPFVVRLAIVLLYTAGLRRGEVARLRLNDVDLRGGVLRILQSKFHKSRYVPLSDSACVELDRYLTLRRKTLHGTCPTAPLLFNGKRLSSCYSGGGFSRIVHQLLVKADIRDSSGNLACVHDFRHSFAVGALRRWYEAGADVQSSLPKLAMYMGHVSIVSTAHYLQCMPAVVARAGERFERSYARAIEGGVQ